MSLTFNNEREREGGREREKERERERKREIGHKNERNRKLYIRLGFISETLQT